MSEFKPAVEKILQYEGGYVNNPKDPGGETNFGISKRQYPSLDIKNLTRDRATSIYYNDYWSPLLLNQINSQAVAEEMLDIAVNLGAGKAARFLQEAINLLFGSDLPVDGVIGKKTIDAANMYRYPAVLAKVLNGMQFEHYHKRVDTHPDQREFLRSWLARVEFREA